MEFSSNTKQYSFTLTDSDSDFRGLQSKCISIPQVRELDTSGDGRMDTLLLDTTGDGRGDTLARGVAVDTTGDGVADSIVVDAVSAVGGGAVDGDQPGKQVTIPIRCAD